MSKRILSGQTRRIADSLERQNTDHWQDRPAVGWAIVVIICEIFAGVVLASYGMGWLS